MSQSNGAGTAPAKALSSRLLTMKFMQRAAASPTTPTTPSTPDEPSAKRRRIDSTPSKHFDVHAIADQSRIQQALAEEEAKRQTALDRQAIEAGDSRWELNFVHKDQGARPSLQVIKAGFAALDYSAEMERDSPEDEDSQELQDMICRRSFGSFGKKPLVSRSSCYTARC